MMTEGVTICNIQYDGDGKWIDVRFSSGASYRLDAGWIVDNIVTALRVHDPRVGLLTGSDVLRWGEKDDEEV